MIPIDREEKDRVLSLLQRLVELESPSAVKAAVDRVGACVHDECIKLGAVIEVHACEHAGDVLEAKWMPLKSKSEEQPILLLCHMDTVFPLGTLAHMPFSQTGEKTYGPGVSDMKGGIVVALSTMRHLMDQLSRPVTILFTADEESGSYYSRALIEERAQRSALVLVMEPGLADGSIKTWRKGVGSYTITAHGKAAHAGGGHEIGRNAIEELAHQIIKIQALTDYSRGTTLNTGVVQGGTVSNVVPDEAFAEIDLRVMQAGEAERIHSALSDLVPVLDGTSLTVTGGVNRPPMPYDDLMKRSFTKAQGIALAHQLIINAGGTGGASDANFVAPLGVPVLDGMGPAGGEYHSEREYIFTQSLFERAELLAFVIREW